MAATLELAYLDSPPEERHILFPCEVYQAWHAAAEDAEEALHAWSAAPAHLRPEAYAVYRAAADREDVAADRWLAA
jgi:hypothetical protein